MSNIPRRNIETLNIEAESVISNAIMEIEALGADERLTNAIIHLTDAKNLVGDYIDEQLKIHLE